MLEIPFPSFRKRRGKRRRRPAPAAPAPAALTLIAAAYVESTYVELTFDRPIDIAALVADQIRVDDGPVSGTLWEGVGAGSTLISPAVVRITLGEFDPSSGTTTVLNATAASGIVAVDDGGTWAGVSDLALPFP